jgi:hypothetical protein
MGDVIDLDAVRGEVEPRHIKLGGREWEIPGELPLVFLELFTTGKFAAAATVLVGPDEAGEFAGLLTVPVFNALVEVYGVNPEPAASSASSKSSGTRARPTSKRTTG